MFVVDPATNTTATIPFNEVRYGTTFGYYKGIAHAPVVSKLYVAPNIEARFGNGSSILVLDPATNATGHIGWWDTGLIFIGVTYVPTVNKLFFAPGNIFTIVILDPVTNVTDDTTLRTQVDYGPFYSLFVFSPATGHVYGVPSVPNVAALVSVGRVGVGSVLIVDPDANTTDVTTLSGVRATDIDTWCRGGYSPAVHKIFASQCGGGTASAVLVLGATTNSAPFYWAPNMTCSIGFSQPWVVWPSIHGVATIPQTIGVCSLYEHSVIPPAIRFGAATTTVRFPGPGLVDIATPARFANWTLDLPHCITLDLSNNAFAELPPRSFLAFGRRVCVLDLSGGQALTTIASTVSALLSI